MVKFSSWHFQKKWKNLRINSCNERVMKKVRSLYKLEETYKLIKWHRIDHTYFNFGTILLHRCLLIEFVTYFYSIIGFEFHSCSNQIFSLFYLWMTAQVDEKKPRKKNDRSRGNEWIQSNVTSSGCWTSVCTKIYLIKPR